MVVVPYLLQEEKLPGLQTGALQEMPLWVAAPRRTGGVVAAAGLV